MNDREELIDFMWGRSNKRAIVRDVTVQELQEFIRQTPDTEGVSVIVELPQGED